MDKNYCKNIIETFIKIRNGNTNRVKLADDLEVASKTITNYINDLSNKFKVNIIYNRKTKCYEVKSAGEFEKIINKVQLEGYHIWIILMILLRTQYIFPYKIKFIKKELLKFAKENEKSKLNEIFDFNINELKQRNENYHEDLLRNIYKAFMENRKIRMRYTPNNKKTKTYFVLPLNITFNNGHIYLIAYNEKQDSRNFRLDRIKNITLLDETYSYEECKFNLTDYLNKSVHMYGGSEEIKIKVKVDIAYAELLKEKFPFICEELSSDEKFVTYEITAYNTYGVLIDLLGVLKDKFEILEPEELRKKVYDIGKGIMEKNNKDIIPE